MLNIEFVGFDLVNMSLYLLESIYALAKFEVAPPSLNAVGCSLVHDLLDRINRQVVPELVGSPCLLYPSCSTCPNKKRFKEEHHRRVVSFNMSLPVVVKNGKAESNQEDKLRRLKHE